MLLLGFESVFRFLKNYTKDEQKDGDGDGIRLQKRMKGRVIANEV